MKYIFILALLATFTFSLRVGDKACLFADLHLRSKPCGDVLNVTIGDERGLVVDVVQAKCDGVTSEWLKLALENGDFAWIPKESDLLNNCLVGVNYNVYYIHQLWDTGNSFNGGWACGPTSSTMAVTFWNKLGKHPIKTDQPTPHMNDYGWYVSNQYKSNQTSYVFNRMQNDASGKNAWGAYGTCTEDGAAWAWRMQLFCEKHGLTTKFYDTATFSAIQTALNAKHLIILSTQLSSVGHIILIRGFDGNNLMVNDPYGDANQPNWGKADNGGNVKYTWPQVKAKWMVEVWQ